ncbi:hypothetical protein ARMGADRAFT_1077488 [Armillaria gallica]|uniref:Uncharacterized protein n=1 Tax=Armillaria gallica TaxID=47427 RepID=A0A2H3DX03_ARMGA|nr:hypothetical protein ARMGADRAFT_1077488 [Armillaria gallica]
MVDIVALIVGIVLAIKAVFLVVLWVLQRRKKHRSVSGNNTDGYTVPMPTVVPDPIIPPLLPLSSLFTQTRSISTLESLPSIVPPPTIAPHPIITPVLPSPPPSARAISTLPSNLPRTVGRTLSQSSRNAYEEEIKRLRREVLTQTTQIRYLHEEREQIHTSTLPPSYRSSGSRRSDISEYFASSSSLPPMPPPPRVG